MPARPAPRLGILLALLLLVLSTAAGATPLPDVPPSAIGRSARADGTDHVTNRLYVDAEAVRPGDTVRVGIHFDLEPGWHVYWLNPGDSGMSTELELSGEHLSFGPVAWPAPRVFLEANGFITTYGYADEVALLSTATVADDARGELTIRATADYLACKTNCVPGRVELSTILPVHDTSDPADPEIGALLDRFAAEVPRVPPDGGIRAELAFSHLPVRPGDALHAAIGLVFCEGPGEADCGRLRVDGDPLWAFVPGPMNGIRTELQAIRKHPAAFDGAVVEVAIDAQPGAPTREQTFNGLVFLRDDKDNRFAVHVSAPMPSAAPGAAVTAGSAAILSPADLPPTGQFPTVTVAADGVPTSLDAAPVSLVWALLLAFIGGMILNLMPCVFPVLALKVFSFTRLAHEERGHVAAHAGAYTSGILAAMLGLAAVVLGLRSAGTSVGWGFQFQEPIFLVGLSALLVVFAMNLFGAFEIGVSAGALGRAAETAQGLQRSFFEGLLAVVLATPCSAPFLGTAVGFALTGSAVDILLIFSALGLGLAAPFVALTLVPGWSRILPAPGDWMVRFKQVMGFFLLATVVWIAWIVGQTTGVDGVAGLLVFLLVVSLAAWIHGATQYAAGVRRGISMFLSAALVVAAGVVFLQLEPAAPDDRSAPAQGGIPWRPWTPDLVRDELAAGRPVFVDFTADWCITCKVNERTVIDTAPVRAALDDLGITPLKADWTARDESIRAELASHGRAGVPLYLLFSPSRPDAPRILPEVLTADLLVNALREAAGRATDTP